MNKRPLEIDFQDRWRHEGAGPRLRANQQQLPAHGQNQKGRGPMGVGASVLDWIKADKRNLAAVVVHP